MENDTPRVRILSILTGYPFLVEKFAVEYCWQVPRPCNLRPPDSFLGFSSEAATAMWGILIAACKQIQGNTAAMVRVFPATQLGSLKDLKVSRAKFLIYDMSPHVHSSFGKVFCVMVLTWDVATTNEWPWRNIENRKISMENGGKFNRNWIYFKKYSKIILLHLSDLYWILFQPT